VSDAIALADRAASILRDEIANGALGNIMAVEHPFRSSWLTDLFTGGPSAARIVGDAVEAVLDLLPRVFSPIVEHSYGPGALPAPVPPVTELMPGAPTAPRVPTVRRSEPAKPGGLATLTTRLSNDGNDPVDVRFRWDDLVSSPAARISSPHVRVLPDLLHLVPGELADILVVLDVPAAARPGLYSTLLGADDLPDLQALLMFPVT